MPLSPLESRLRYEFRNAELLRQALTHRSHSASHNERLEFLGDSVLNCAVAALLFQRFGKLDEGDLSRVRANLVKQQSLYEIAQALNIADSLRLGEGELRSGGFRRPSILADAFEAILGAIFLDGGFEAAQTVIKRLYVPILDHIDPRTLGKDSKTLLQEYLQGHKIALPTYTVVATHGAAHNQQFEVECTVPKLEVKVSGSGASRRAAEQAAAKKALDEVLALMPAMGVKTKRSRGARTAKQGEPEVVPGVKGVQAALDLRAPERKDKAARGTRRAQAGFARARRSPGQAGGGGGQGGRFERRAGRGRRWRYGTRLRHRRRCPAARGRTRSSMSETVRSSPRANDAPLSEPAASHMNDPLSTGFRCGMIAIVGRPNVGKSTLMNALVGQKISITSRKAQTTRHRITGIHTFDDAQYIFVDTPGFQTQHSGALNRSLNRAVTSTLTSVDAILFVIEAGRFGPDDQRVLDLIPPSVPTLLIANKLDRVSDKKTLFPFFQKMGALRDFKEIVPLSAKHTDDITRLLATIKPYLPQGEPIYGEDDLTDRSERFLAAEILREKVFRWTGDELPYTSTVLIEKFETEGRLRRVFATILVDRDSHKAMIIGQKGAKLKQISTEARLDMEKLFDGPVYLETFIKVKSGWADNEAGLRAYGYE